MICILLFTVIIVLTKVSKHLGLYLCMSSVPLCFLPLPQVYIIDPAPNPNISTFKPVPQMINDNKKYNGNGYLPCNGFVPCQVCVTVWGVEHDHPCHSAWSDGTLAAGGEAGGCHALSWLSGEGGGARGMLVITCHALSWLSGEGGGTRGMLVISF